MAKKVIVFILTRQIKLFFMFENWTFCYVGTVSYLYNNNININ